MSNKELEMKAQEHDLTDATPEAVAEAAKTTEKAIEEAVVGGYKMIETGVVEGYKKIEDKFTATFLNEDGSLKTGSVGNKFVDSYKKVESSVVGGFNKIADKFVDTFLAKDGETTEQARERMAAEQKAMAEAARNAGKKL